MNILQFFGLGINFFDIVDITIPPMVIFALGAVVLVVMIWHYLRRQQVRSAAIKYSDVRIVSRATPSHRRHFRVYQPD